MADLPATFAASPGPARNVLRCLLSTPITVTPDVKDGALSFRFSGHCRYGGLDQTLLARGQMVMTAADEPLTGDLTRRMVGCRVEWWCPRGDSNTRHAV